MVQNDLLDNKRDIFYLYIDEIKNQENDFRSIIDKRKKEEKRNKEKISYNRIVFANKISDVTPRNEKETIPNVDNQLYGISTSVGNIKGEVLVIKDTNQSYDTNGKILVTKTTDPGWIFLIQNAKGIIAEKGSMLSHTAIISRELKKPAIVNVKDCTSILKNGDIVELDADNGIVKILEKENV